MEPLSPRHVNIQSKVKIASKNEVQSVDAKKAAAQRDKNLADPPPPLVVQPPVEYGSLSEKYKIGGQLGKGGFAICYEGELQCRKPGKDNKVFAMKVVRAKMNQRKMEDKVLIFYRKTVEYFAKISSSEPSYRSMRRCITPILLNSTAPLLTRTIRTWSSSYAPTALSWI